MNKDKTEIIFFGRDKIEIQVKISEADIRQVDNTKYLGAMITRESRNKLEITESIVIFGEQAALLNPILRDRHVSLEVKKTIYNTILRSILLYGCES